MRRLTALPPIHQTHDVPHASFNAPRELFRLKNNKSPFHFSVKADVYETTTDPFSGAHYIRSTDCIFSLNPHFQDKEGGSRGSVTCQDEQKVAALWALALGVGGWQVVPAAPGTGLQGQIGFLKNNLS